jgi:hypothetical protein
MMHGQQNINISRLPTSPWKVTRNALLVKTALGRQIFATVSQILVPLWLSQAQERGSREVTQICVFWASLTAG